MSDRVDESRADHADDANTEAGGAEASITPVKPRSRLRRVVISVVRIVVIAYVAFAALLYGCQSRFIYAPRQEMEGTPEDFRMPFEEVSLHTSDGVKLAAWFVPAEEGNERGVLLFCHGNAGNMSHRLDTIYLYRGMGLSVLIFDYRGYGLSEGSPSEEGTYRDARAAWDYLVKERGVDPSRIVVFGRSLGGAIAGRLASEKHPGATILESTFTSVPDLGAELYPFLPVRLLSRFSYNTLALVDQFDSPLLVIHSEDDQMIPFSQGEALYNAAAMPKQFLKIHGGHNEGYFLSEREYTRGVRTFLDGALPVPTGVGFLQGQLIYWPDRHVDSSPSDFHMPFEEVSLHASDNVKLSAWYIPAEEGSERGVLLFCHGNGGNMSDRIDSIHRFRQMGLSVLIFDYRGYGLSEGSPSEEGTYRDARAAWDYLTEKRGVDPARIVVFGRSLGGAIAARLASEKHPCVTILESTFTSVPNLGAKLYPHLPVRLLCRYTYDTLSVVHELDCPLLVIHSEDDEMIPFEEGQALYAAAEEPKQLLKIRGGHNEGYVLSERDYTRGVRAFLDQTFPTR